MRLLFRILLLPFGLLWKLCLAANDGARDLFHLIRYRGRVGRGTTLTPDTVLGRTTRILPRCILNHCRVGEYTYISEGSVVQHATIGDYCSIARGVTICPGRHPLDREGTSPVYYTPDNYFGEKRVPACTFEEYLPVEIADDVWIGTGAIILDGVKIARGAVVAAGAVVTKDVPERAVVGGVPAKVIKYRQQD